MSFLAAVVFATSPMSVPILDVPSGQPVQLHDVLIDDIGGETWLRFRFLAPDIARAGGKVTFAQAEPDLEYLCTQVALPYVTEFDLKPEVVAVMLLDHPIEFGASDTRVTQFIDFFRVTSGTCIWEGL